jgi:hypothetical protein
LAASELCGGFEQILCSELPGHWQARLENTNLEDATPSDKWFVGLKAAYKALFLDYQLFLIIHSTLSITTDNQE